MESNPVIKDILGRSCKIEWELVVPGAIHFLLRKSHIPNHVSSTLRIVLPETNSFIYSKANYWRRQRLGILFAFFDIWITFLNFIPRSLLITVLISDSLLSMPDFSYNSFLIDYTESKNYSFSFISFTFYAMFYCLIRVVFFS